MANSDIQLIVGADTMESYKQLKTDIEGLIARFNNKKSTVKIKVGVQLDNKTQIRSQLLKEIQSVTSKLSSSSSTNAKIKLEIDKSYIERQYKSVISSIAKGNFAKIEGLSLIDSKTLEKTKTDAAELKRIIREFQSGTLTPDTVKALGIDTSNMETSVKKVEDMSKRIKNAQNQLKSLTGSVKQLGITDSGDLVAKAELYATEMQKIIGLEGQEQAQAMTALEQKIGAYQQEITQVQILSNIQETKGRQQQAMEKEEEKSIANKTSAYTKQLNLMSKIQDYQRSNTKINGTSYGNQLYGILGVLTSEKSLNTKQLDGLTNKFKALKNDITQAGLAGKSFSDVINSGLKKFSSWFGISQLVMRGVQGLNQMITTVTELDTAMTELKKVTDLTDAEYTRFGNTAAGIAKQVGATISDTINSTADFARLGYTLDESTQLSKAALVYKNVGDGINDIGEASESIISTIKAFGIEAENAMGIVDRFNEVGNNFAISSEGIGTALKKSAASLAASGNSIEESIGLATGMNAVIQNPETVGTALKTLTMYLRAAKVEAQEAGEDTEGMANSVSELQKSILTLTKGKVDIMTDANNFKSTYQIIKEISGVWEDMAEVDQAALLKLIAGKRNANVVTSLITNFKDAEEAMKAASDATGSATVENEKYLDSIEGRKAKLKASFESLSADVFESDTLKTTVNVLNGIVEAFDWLISNTGGIAAVLVLISSTIAMANAAKIHEFIDTGISTKLASMRGSIKTFLSTFNTGFKEAKAAGSSFSSSLSAGFKAVSKGALATKVAIAGVTVAVIAMAIAYQQAKRHQEDIANTANEVVNTYKSQTEKLSDFGRRQEEVTRRYAELSEGVDAFGHNISLTSDEFAEYNQISNEVADLFPALIQGYNDEGFAILSCKNNVEKLSDAYLKAKIAANNAVIGSKEIGEHWKGVANELAYGVDQHSFSSTIANYGDFLGDKLSRDFMHKQELSYASPTDIAYYGLGKSNYNILNELLNSNDLSKYINDNEAELSKYARYIQDTLNQLGVDTSKIQANHTTGKAKDIEEYKNQLLSIFQDPSNVAAIRAGLKSFESEYQTGVDELTTLMNSVFQNSLLDEKDAKHDIVNGLSSDIQSMISYAIQNIDFEQAFEIGSADDPNAAAIKYVYDLIDSSAKLDAESGFAEQMSHVSGLGQGKMSKAMFEKYQSEMNDFIAQINASDMDDNIKNSIKQYFTNAYDSINTDDLLDTSKISSLGKTMSEATSQVLKEASEFGFSKKDLETTQKIIDAQHASFLIDPNFHGIFGNIDMNNRQPIKFGFDKNGLFNPSSIEQYRDALESYNIELSDVMGTTATVLGMWESYGDLDIAFTPMLQTGDGAKLLDAQTMDEYIWALIDRLGAGGKEWTTEDLLNLDAQGLIIQGQLIQNMIADVGKTAQKTSEKMHFLGTDGALQQAMREDAESTKEAQAAWDEYVNSLTEVDKDIAFGIYLDSEEATYSLEEFQKKMNSLTQDEMDYYSSRIYNDAELITNGFNDAQTAKTKFDEAMQNVVEYDTNFNSYVEAVDKLREEIKEGRSGSKTAERAADYLFGEGFLEGHTAEQVEARLNEIEKVFDTHTDKDGKEHNTYGFGFIEQLATLDLSDLNSSVSKLKDGTFDVQLDPAEIDIIARKMRLTTDEVWACIEALKMMGGVDLFDEASFDRYISDLQKTDKEYSNLKQKINGDEYLDVDKLAESFEGTSITIKDCKEEIDSFVKKGGKIINLTGDIDQVTDSLKSLNIASGKENKLHINLDNLETTLTGLGKTKDEIAQVVTKLKNAKDNGDVDITFTVTDKNGKNTVKGVEDKLNQLSSKADEAGGNVSDVGDKVDTVDNKTVDNATSSIGNLNTQAQNANTQLRNISSRMDALNGKQAKMTVSIGVTGAGTGVLWDTNPSKKTKNSGSGSSWLNGTAYANGGAPRTETALMGEVAPEMWVHARTGKWELVDRPQFSKVERGDVIFNGKQTRDLLRNGYSDDFGASYLGGTAYIQIKTPDKQKPKSPNSNEKSTKKKTTKTNSDKKDGKDPTVFDWIEVAIDRIERKIKNLARVAESSFKSLATRLSYTKDEIKAINSEINIQDKGYARYIKEAKDVSRPSGVSKDKWNEYKEKVRNGKISISEIKNESLAKALEEYQKYYDLALKCKDATKELKEERSKLYLDQFNLIAEDYDSQISLIEHLTKTYDIGIEKLQAKGLIGSTKYLQAKKKAQQDTKAKLQNDLADLQKALSDAMNNGEIKKGSKAWYEMQNEINATKEAIEESELAVLELDKAIRELDWEYFEFMQSQISRVASEGNFLINTLSRKDLYNDDGAITNEGQAVMGLHGMNYNVYMAQANAYKDEIANINKELANDPNNKDLIDQKNSLVDAYQDAISSALDEKDAIKDLVEDGIQREIDSLNDLIDKYKDSLDSAKDLYDYQKKIKNQSEDVAKLQKRLSAYEGDTSEENKSTIQKLRLELENAQEDLEETEYEHMISEQKAMLDDLSSNYEEILNERLDDIDGLIQDVINSVNDNQANIYNTLLTTADDVGYVMSGEMDDIWNNTQLPVLSDYHSGFTTTLTTISDTLTAIQTSVNNMKIVAEEEAEAEIANTTPITQPTKPAATTNTSKPSTKPTTTKPTTAKPTTSKSSGNGKATVGEQVTYKSGNYHASSDGTGSSGSKNQGKKVYITKIASGSKYPYHISTGKKLGSGDLGWVKLSQISGYASGGYVGEMKNITAKNGDNLISINTLKKGEAVLTPEQAKQFSKLVSSLPYLRDLIDIGVNTDALSQVQPSGNTIGEILINIPIERVIDYNDFVSQLQKDRQFEKLVRSMSTDLLAGKSSLSKNKYKW